MNNIENLHTAVRRYCMDNHFYWSKKYSEMNTGGAGRSGYTDEHLMTFPRYNVLNAILIEVERYRPEDFKTFEEAKHFICLIANEAQSVSTKPPNGNIQQKAMDEERDKLCKFINQLTEEDLSSVEPLFYRRVLSNDERQKIWSELKSKWKISDHYWYPLSLEKPESVEAFQDSYFEREVGVGKLREILINHGVENVWEIREDEIDFELELSIFEPYYNGAEGFWCDSKFDWIIYASHESSITIGGWLLAEIKNVWSNWEKRIWTTPFFN
jgi:hypothetical protein